MSTALAPSRRLANGLLSVTTAVVGVGLTLGAWWLLSLRLEPVQLPSPGAVGEAFLDGWSGIDALEFVGFQTGGDMAVCLRQGLRFVGTGKLGIYNKARLGNTFRYELEALGYNAPFAAELSERLVIHIASKK